MTSTVIEHDPKAATRPLVSATTPLSSTALTSPSQVLETLAGDATVIAAGRLSVKARSTAAAASLLTTLNVRVVALPGPMVDGVKTF